MARFSRLQVWNKMEEVGLVPLFYHADAEMAKKIVEAISAGGGKVIEFTNRGDRAFEVFRELIAALGKGRSLASSWASARCWTRPRPACTSTWAPTLSSAR